MGSDHRPFRRQQQYSDSSNSCELIFQSFLIFTLLWYDVGVVPNAHLLYNNSPSTSAACTMSCKELRLATVVWCSFAKIFVKPVVAKAQLRLAHPI